MIIQAYHDSDLARDQITRRSVNAIIFELNGVAIDWICKKQPLVAEHSNGSEIRSLFTGVRRTYCIRTYLAMIGFTISAPTPTFEDNAETIVQVTKNIIAPQERPVDIMITSLHEHKNRGTFTIAYCKTTLMLEDFLSKPQGGYILLDKVLWAIGHRFYPPQTSQHYKHLQLRRFPIGELCNAADNEESIRIHS